MSEMVERVVRAMAESDFPKSDYANFHKAWHERYERYARAAIEAMREPTHEMMDDGHRAAGKVRRSGICGMTIEAQTRAECAREIAAWHAMIDAALGENVSATAGR